MSDKGKEKSSLMANIERIILILGFGVLIASFVLGPTFRDVVAGGVDKLVEPIITTMPFYIVIMVIAIIVATCSSFIQKYTMNWELMRRVTEKNKVFQKEFREAQLSGNKHKLKKLEEERMSMLEDQTSMSKQQMKPLAYITLISIPLFIWAFWYLSQPQHAGMSMTFPFWGEQLFTTTAFFVFQYWIVWSIMCSLAVSQVIRKAFNVGV
ncbi:hypothetical protein CUJ83_00570 [Methanocella sp. CWC-04]|uniref:DUF106 domain-containing protein n=1 Tax=Methanooceanicella nereidis TaxID=2052831 RepID=A0AAP2W4K7_9EURY|nr:EMC3/TMCO1 family protein [Methanocella sp. CWC-04]MCD1293488.1 hypothetical protein [Methanocella sp. CWC-04]